MKKTPYGMKLPITEDKYFYATPLANYVLVDNVTRKAEFDPFFKLSKDVQEWFERHCDTRIRFMYANNKDWRATLQGKRRGVDERDFVMAFIEHWLKAFMQNPSEYQRRHPFSAMEECTPTNVAKVS
jgi:hypothetical protein